MASKAIYTVEYQHRFCDVEEEPSTITHHVEGHEHEPLVTLEEAIVGLEKYYSNIFEQASIAKRDCKKPPAHGLSVDESAAIRLYTTRTIPEENAVHVILNQVIRSVDSNRLAPWYKYIKLLITAFNKIPTTRGLAFRGVKKDLSSAYAVKTRIYWRGFTSFTGNLSLLENPYYCGKTGDRTIFAVTYSAGTSIREYSSSPDEDEVLFLPGTEFCIFSHLDAGNGLHTIDLRDTNLTIKINQEPPLVSPTVLSDPFQTLREHIARIPFRDIIVWSDQMLLDESIKIIGTDGIQGKHCRGLVLSRTSLTKETISKLTVFVHNSDTLETLDLSRNELSFDALSPLIQTLKKPLKRTQNRYVFGCIKRFEETTMPPIKELDLAENRIGDEGIGSLIEVLKANSNLTSLSLKKNEITNFGVQQLIRYLSTQESRLERLYLDDNKEINSRCVESLVKLLEQNKSMKTLSLVGCHFTANDTKDLRRVVLNRKNFFLNVELIEEVVEKQ